MRFMSNRPFNLVEKCLTGQKIMRITAISIINHAEKL